METWYLLFDGNSPDGRGEPEFISRTTNKYLARKHYEECSNNPYSIGEVWYVTDKEHNTISFDTDWSRL